MAISVNQLIPGYVDQTFCYITTTLHQACATVETKNKVAGRILSFPVTFLLLPSIMLTNLLNMIETVALAALNGLGVACEREGCKANLTICAKRLPNDLLRFGIGCSSIYFPIFRIAIAAGSLVLAFDNDHQRVVTQLEIDFIKISCQRKYPTIYDGMEENIDLLPPARQNELYRQLLTIPEEELPSFEAALLRELPSHIFDVRYGKSLVQIRRDIPVYQRAAEARHGGRQIAHLETEINRLPSMARQLQRYIELATLPRSSLDQFRQSLQDEVAAL